MRENIKVLSIGTDKKLFEEGSAVALRQIAYGKKMEELHIVVFTTRTTKKNSSIKNINLSDNVFLYPTNSFSRWFYIFDAMRIGKKILNERLFSPQNSIITCQDPFESGLTGFFLAKRFSMRLHLQIHTDFLSPYFNRGFLNKIRVFIAKFIISKAYRIRVVSKRIRDSLSKEKIKLQNPVQILPIRIDIESMRAGSPEDSLRVYFPEFTNIVFMASRLTKEKRVNDALCSFKKVLEDFPLAGLVIAGDGPEMNNLKKMANELGIYKSVRFMGWQKNVASLMSSTDVFFSTSEYEGYGMSLVEAGLALCPIVSTDVGISGEILKDGLNSFVCPVRNISCFTEKIKELLADSALRGTLSGRLNSDIRGSIPTVEEYMTLFIDGLK